MSGIRATRGKEKKKCRWLRRQFFALVDDLANVLPSRKRKTVVMPIPNILQVECRKCEMNQTSFTERRGEDGVPGYSDCYAPRFPNLIEQRYHCFRSHFQSDYGLGDAF